MIEVGKLVTDDLRDLFKGTIRAIDDNKVGLIALVVVREDGENFSATIGPVENNLGTMAQLAQMDLALNCLSMKIREIVLNIKEEKANG